METVTLTRNWHLVCFDCSFHLNEIQFVELLLLPAFRENSTNESERLGRGHDGGLPVDNVIVAIIYNVRALYIYNVRRLRSFKDIARKRRVKQNSVGN